MLSLADRLEHDPKFRQLVDVLFMYIQNADFTPTEIREAAMLAQIKYENSRLHSFLIDAEGRLFRDDEIVERRR